jgi:NAD-dependent DNA ligase
MKGKVVEDIKKKIGQLRLTCLQHRYRYYVLCSPTISDFSYDALERELRGLVQKYPEVANEACWAEFCPVVTVGSEMEDSYPVEARV